MDDSDALIPRRAFEVASELLAGSRGIVVNGPRQSGKTELLGMLHRQLGGTSPARNSPSSSTSSSGAETR